jgi:hypothetical protein
MLDRKKLAETVKEATDKAGSLVMAALAVACTALLVALAAVVMAFRGRRLAG